jgi:exodeoxyribonuclease V gamma subunit
MPGFQVVYSNRMEVLAESLAERISVPLSSPFEPETVIVQSRGMQRWLNLELARQTGVCANMVFPFPVPFLHDLFRRNLGDLPAAYPYEQERMRWMIMGLLGEMLESAVPPPSDFAPLMTYCGDDPVGLKRFGLARKLAYLLDRYLIFRPEMLLSWEKGGAGSAAQGNDPASLWQGRLWNLVVEGCGPHHRARLQDRFLASLRESRELELPERISVFGISSMPPAQLLALHGLSRAVDVAFFVLNPCREFWEDLVSDRRRQQILSRRSCGAAGVEHLEEGHPLLSSWGRLNQEFLAQLTDMTEGNSLELYDSPGMDTLLHDLQSAILDLRPAGQDRRVIESDDLSLQVHSCHSPLREVEVLQDVLLSLFERDPGLTPRDILVMAPDIEAYAPFIQAVFDAPEQLELAVPFAIADRTATGESGLAAVFLEILEAASGRLSPNRVLELLERPAVRSRFGILENDLEPIHRWVRDTRICWGADETSREELGLPPFRENSWSAGIERLLLGLAMDSDPEQAAFRDILPYPEIEGSSGRILGLFVEFFDRLAGVSALMKSGRPPGEWSRLLLESAEALLEHSASAVDDWLTLRETLCELLSIPAEAGFDRPVSPEVVLAWLRERIGNAVSSGRFLSGGVTFCSMVPMRSIPFKVVCLLGMNSDSYPRQEVAADFDLMARTPRPGDRNARLDDRSLFLEALVSTRDALLLCFQGRDPQSNAPRPPSVLVSELLDMLDRGYIMADGTLPSQGMVTEHRLQSYSPDYFTPGPRLFSYSRDACESARALFLPPVCTPFPPARLAEPPQELKVLSLDRLRWLLLDAPAFFLKERLGADLRLGTVLIEEEECLAGPGGLERFQIGQEILSWLEAGKPAEQLLPLTRSRGLLPPSALGAAAFERVAEQARDLHGRISALAGSRVDDLALRLELDGFTLTGRIRHRTRAGIVQARFTGGVGARDLLRAWVSVLALSVHTGAPAWAYVLGREPGWARLAAPDDSWTVLSSLLSLYWEGLSTPLCFFPESSLAYARTMVKGEGSEKSFAAARRPWVGGFGRKGEGDTPAARLCFPDLEMGSTFGKTAMTVFEPLLRNLEEHRQ